GESDRMANANKADLTTYASVLLAIDHVVDLLRRARIASFDHSCVPHPGLRAGGGNQGSERTAQQSISVIAALRLAGFRSVARRRHTSSRRSIGHITESIPRKRRLARVECRRLA